MFFLLRPRPFRFSHQGFMSQSGRERSCGVECLKKCISSARTQKCAAFTRGVRFQLSKWKRTHHKSRPAIPRPANSNRQYRTACREKNFDAKMRAGGGGVAWKNRCHKFHYTSRARFSLLWRLRRRKNRGDSSTSTREASSSCRNCRGLQ